MPTVTMIWAFFVITTPGVNAVRLEEGIGPHIEWLGYAKRLELAHTDHFRRPLFIIIRNVDNKYPKATPRLRFDSPTNLIRVRVNFRLQSSNISAIG